MEPLSSRVYAVRDTVPVTDAAVVHLADYAHPERGGLVMVVFGASAPPQGALLVPGGRNRFLVVAPDGTHDRAYVWSTEDSHYSSQPDPLPVEPQPVATPVEASLALQAETAVRLERGRQRSIWTDYHDACHPPTDWVQLITEHAGKLFVAAEAYTDDRYHERNMQGQIDYRHVLAEIGALALAALEVEYGWDALKTGPLWADLQEMGGGTLAEAVAEEPVPAPTPHFRSPGESVKEVAVAWGGFMKTFPESPLTVMLREQTEQTMLAHSHAEDHKAMGAFGVAQTGINEVVAGRLSDIERALTAMDVRVEALENPPAPEVAPDPATMGVGDLPEVLVAQEVRTMRSTQPDGWTLVVCSDAPLEAEMVAFMLPADRMLDMETGNACVKPGDRLRWHPAVAGKIHPTMPVLEVLSRDGTTASPEYILDGVVPVRVSRNSVPEEGYGLLCVRHVGVFAHTNYFVCWRDGDRQQVRPFPAKDSSFANSDLTVARLFFEPR